MYQIKINDNFFFGTGIYLRPGYEIVLPKLSLEKNMAGSFTFTVYPNHPEYGDIQELTSYVEVTVKSEVLFRGRVISIQKGFYNEKQVICEGCLAYLMDTIQRPYDFLSGTNHTTPEALFRFFIIRHNAAVDSKRRFIIGKMTVTDPNNYIVRSDSTYLNTWESVCQKLLDGFGGLLRVRFEGGDNYIDYLAESNEVSSQTIEFGKNLIDIKQTENADEIATVIIPVGMEVGNGRATITPMPNEETDDICKFGDKIYSKKGIEKYGYIEKSIIFDDTALPTNLIKNAKSYLMKTLNISKSIELSASDLSAVNTEIESFRIGELVKVVSKPHGVEKQFEVSKLNIDLTNLKSNKLTLGSLSDSLTSQISSGSSGGGMSYSGGSGGGTARLAGTGLELFGNTINHSNSITEGSVGNFPNAVLNWDENLQIPAITYDSEGHIKSVKTRLVKMPNNPDTQYISGDGIDIADNVISVLDVISAATVGVTTASTPPVGGGFSVPWIKYNNKGQIVGAGSRTVVLPKYKAGTGISVSEDTINHINSINPGTAGNGGGGESLKFGSMFTVPWVSYDAQGHITASGAHPLFMPSETLNTAGSTQKSDGIMYLVGSPKQLENGQTYSNSSCYVADNCLYSNGSKVITNVDSVLSEDSENPIENKTVKAALDQKSSIAHTHNYAGSLTAGGSATSADKLNTSAGGSSQPVYFSDGVPVAIAGKWPTSTFKTAFRTQAKGDTAQGSFLTTIRNQHAGVDSLPQYGSGIAFGQGDTNAFLSTSYSDAEAYIGAGSGNSITWSKKIAFTDSNVASATTSATATKATQDSDGNTINTTYLKKSGGTISNSWTSYAGFQGLTIYRSNLSLATYPSYMKFAHNMSDCGFVGMNGNGDFKTADKNGTNTSIISGNGILKTAGSGKLLYSGTISATSGSITIENLWEYSTLLFEFHNMTPTSTIRPQSLSIMIPVQYVNGSSYTARGNIIDGLSGFSLANGATMFLSTSFTGYVIFTKSSAENTVTLESQSILGTIKVYSII